MDILSLTCLLAAVVILLWDKRQSVTEVLSLRSEILEARNRNIVLERTISALRHERSEIKKQILHQHENVVPVWGGNVVPIRKI